MERLETKRLILRDWSLADAEDMFAYAKNPNVGPFAGWKPHESIEESTGIIQSFINQGEAWAIELKSNGRVIGSIGLHSDSTRSNPRTRMIGYVLAHEHWGNGYAVEAASAVIDYAFNRGDIDLLSIFHFDFNPRSGRVAQKLNFVKEGVMADACLLYDGRVCDRVIYSLRAQDYFSSWE